MEGRFSGSASVAAFLLLAVAGCGDGTGVELSKLTVTLALSADQLTIGDTIRVYAAIENRTAHRDSVLVNRYCPLRVWIRSAGGEPMLVAPHFCNSIGPGWQVLQPGASLQREYPFDGENSLAMAPVFVPLPEGEYVLYAEIAGTPAGTSEAAALTIRH